MSADFLALVQGEKRQSKGLVLGQSFADHLARQIVNLLCQRQYRCIFQIFQKVFHSLFPFSESPDPAVIRPGPGLI